MLNNLLINIGRLIALIAFLIVISFKLTSLGFKILISLLKGSDIIKKEKEDVFNKKP